MFSLIRSVLGCLFVRSILFAELSEVKISEEWVYVRIESKQQFLDAILECATGTDASHLLTMAPRCPNQRSITDGEPFSIKDWVLIWFWSLVGRRCRFQWVTISLVGNVPDCLSRNFPFEYKTPGHTRDMPGTPRDTSSRWGVFCTLKWGHGHGKPGHRGHKTKTCDIIVSLSWIMVLITTHNANANEQTWQWGHKPFTVAQQLQRQHSRNSTVDSGNSLLLNRICRCMLHLI